MSTNDKLKELEARKKAELAAINEKYAAQEEQLKQVSKAGEEFAALVTKFKYESATDFLSAIGVVVAKKNTKKKSGPPSGQGAFPTKKLAVLLAQGKSAEEIAKELNRKLEKVQEEIKKVTK